MVGQREGAAAAATSMAGEQRNVRGGAGGVEEEWRSSRSRSRVIEGERGRIDEDSRHGSRKMEELEQQKNTAAVETDDQSKRAD